MKKYLKVIGMMVILGSSISYAGPVADTGAAVASVAKAASTLANTLATALDRAINGESFTQISNSTLDNKIVLQNESLFVASNVGIKISGRRVIIDNSNLKNEIQANSVVAAFANLGIEIGGEEVKITNSDILNNLKAEGLVIIGGNTGIKIGG